jgi:hypothetical protein
MRNARWVGLAAVLGLMAFATISAAAEKEEKESKHIRLPEAISKSLKAKYPHAEIRGLSKEKNEKGKTIYEVEMIVPTRVDAEFEEDGELAVVEREIGAFELPEVVRKAAAKHFHGGKIRKAETVLEEEGELKYELVIQHEGKKPFEVVFSGSGNILKNGSKAAGEDHEKAEAKEHEKGEQKAKKHEEEEDDDKPVVKKHESSGHRKAKKDKDDDDDEDDKPKANREER